MKNLIYPLLIIILSSCVDMRAFYQYQYLDNNTIQVNSYANHDAGSGYAEACYEIGAADITLNAGKKYFIFLDQTLMNDPYSLSTTTAYNVPNVSVPLATTTTTTINTWTKNGKIRIFDEKPNADYVIVHTASDILGKWHQDVISKCRGF